MYSTVIVTINILYDYIQYITVCPQPNTSHITFEHLIFILLSRGWCSQKWHCQ